MAKKIKQIGRFTHTKGLGEAGEKYESGYGATVSRRPAFTHGLLLREGRKKLKLSQSAVADATGRNVSEISRGESSSDFFPRVVNLVQHLNALGMQLAIIDQDGEVHALPVDDFLWADNSVKSAGAKARVKKRRK
jgi:hypothetical protein